MTDGETRSVKRCPSCGNTGWNPRVGSIAGSHGDSNARYRCKKCGWRGDELEESETDAPANITHGLGKRLLELADEHDGDVPIRGGSA